MSKILSTITNPALVSRHHQLAVEESFTIDNAVHADGEKILRGTLFGKIVATSKYRAYAEGVVAGAFAVNSKAFTLSGAAAKHFRSGDVIQSTASEALGTIDDYDPETGIGTLVANSTTALAADGSKSVRIPLATLALADSAGKVLKDEVTMDDTDAIGVGYFEGFLVQSLTTITAAALAALGGVTTDTDEVRLK